jgi:hypothetical protein
MKIGILTFHHEDNYGAVLQAFALQEFLREQGYDVEVINFNRWKSKFQLKKWLGKSIGKTFFKTKKELIDLFGSKKRSKVFSDFRRDYLEVGKCFYPSVDALRLNPPDLDVLVVGSDQVWSPKLVDAVDYPAYWLDFCGKQTKKISYAASFGGEYGENPCYFDITKWAKEFAQISVREEKAIEFLQRKGIGNAAWVPDPTFLIDWESLEGVTSGLPRKAIGRFVLNRQNLGLALQLNSELKSIEALRHENSIDINSLNLSPIEWVERISSMRFVITDSFHGTVFCLLTNTPFLVILWQGAAEARNDRILSLLEGVRLKSRAVNESNMNASALVEEGINWDAVNFEIGRMRQSGKSFLSRALSGFNEC